MVEMFTRLGRRVRLDNLARGFQIAFSTAGTEAVLPYLVEFCGASDPAPKTPDLFMQGRTAGRRDVWLEIQRFIHLTDRELMELFAGRQVQTHGE
jgi:hypothetical protein